MTYIVFIHENTSLRGRTFKRRVNKMNSTFEQVFIETCRIFDLKLYVVIKFPDTWSVILYAIALAINLCLIFTTLFFNGVTVATIWKSRRLREIKSNFLIMIQSMVDLANGIFFMTLSATLFVYDLSGKKSCAIPFLTRTIGVLLFFYSMVAMSVMNLERYFGVLFPFIHYAEVTKARLLKYFISVSSLETLVYLGGIIFVGKKANKLFYSINLFSFLVLTAYVHLRIFWGAVKKKRLVGPDYELGSASRKKKMEKKARFMKQIKIAKSCFLVVFASYFCCLPGIIMFGNIAHSETNFSILTLMKFSTLLIMLNSTLNSLIFFWCNTGLRKEGLALMRSLLRRQPSR